VLCLINRRASENKPLTAAQQREAVRGLLLTSASHHLVFEKGINYTPPLSVVNDMADGKAGKHVVV